MPCYHSQKYVLHLREQLRAERSRLELPQLLPIRRRPYSLLASRRDTAGTPRLHGLAPRCVLVSAKPALPETRLVALDCLLHLPGEGSLSLGNNPHGKVALLVQLEAESSHRQATF